ncbi:MAG: hypothetical protein ACLP7A_06845, partial [Desulfobaccales bacterium]
MEQEEFFRFRPCRNLTPRFGNPANLFVHRGSLVGCCGGRFPIAIHRRPCALMSLLLQALVGGLLLGGIYALIAIG